MKLKNLLPLLLISIFMGTTPVSAAEFYLQDETVINSRGQEDLYILSKEVTVAAAQKGSIWAGAGTIRISGDVAQDLVLIGGDVQIPRMVGDDAILIANDVEIRGVIRGDVIFLGGRMTVAREARIEGSLYAIGQTIRMMGQVDGEAVLRGSDLEMTGTVKKNLFARGTRLEIAGEVLGKSVLGADRVQVRPDSKFSSDIRFFSIEGKPDFSSVIAPGVVVTEDPVLAQSQEEAYLARKAAPVFTAVFGWQGVLASIAAAFVLILLYMLLFPAVLLGSGRAVASSPLASLGTGILFMLLIPLGSLLLSLTVIGIPAALLLIALYSLMIAVGRSMASTVFAIATLHKLHLPKSFFYIVGLALVFDAVFTLLVYIPIFGWGVIWLSFLTGAGGIFHSSFREKFLHSEAENT